MSTLEERLAERGIVVRNDRSGSTLVVRGSGGLVATGFDETQHPREPGGQRIGGRWARKAGITILNPTLYSQTLAKGDGLPLPPGRPPKKGKLAQEVYGDAENTEELYRDIERYPDTDGWPPDRAALHEAIIDSLLEGHKPPEGQPRTVFMAGGSGAGKSTLADPLVAELDAVVVNPDDVKVVLPEYIALAKAGDDYAAWGVHEESSYVAKGLLQEAQDRGLNIVVDGTGDSGEGKFLGKVNDSIALGRDTSVILVDIPTDEAIRRADERSRNPNSPSYGRVVPESEIRRVHQSVAANHKLWADQVENWEVWNSEGDKGTPPTLIAKKGRGR